MPEIRINSNPSRSRGGNPEDHETEGTTQVLAGLAKATIPERNCVRTLAPAVPAGMPGIPINPAIFREYDVRGVVGVDLDESVYLRTGRAFATYLKNRSGLSNPSCVVGRDNRPSSVSFATAFCQGLLEQGCDVFDIGMSTTPELYFANDFLNTTGGAAITASHNPAQYNGVKFTYAAKSAGGDEVRAVRDLTLASQTRHAGSRGRLENRDLRSDYLAALSEDALSLSGLTIVLDCGNGVSSLFAPVFFRSLGARVVELHCDPEKPFAVHLPDPVDPDNYADLSSAVRHHGADVGLMFDGDGDRVGAVDERGKIVSPDQLLIIFARKYLKDHPGQRVVVEIKCSQAVEDEVRTLGGQTSWSPTGRTLIEDILFSKRAQLAGEMSGHFFFLDGKRPWLSESLVAARRLLEQVKADGPLSKQVASMPQYVSSREFRVDVPEEKKFKLVKTLVASFKGHYDVLTLDGAKVLYPDGWGLVRASNSEPKLSMRFEAKTTTGLSRIQSDFKRELLANGISVPF